MYKRQNESIGNTLKGIALLVGLGSMFGAILEESGGAQTLAVTMVRKFGDEKAAWALGITGLVVAMPVFFDAGLIILIPLASAMPFIMDGIMVGATETKVMRNSMLLSTVAYFGIFYSLYPVIGNNALWLAFTLYMFLRGTLQLLMTRRLRLIYRKAAA